MCEKCHIEKDDDYEGSSIEEKRRKVVNSVIERHPELGLEPSDVLFRFAPKTAEQCVRINLNSSPKYEIHIRGNMGAAMKDSPSLWGIAVASFVESDHSYQIACDILEISPFVGSLDALFVSRDPPIDIGKADIGQGVWEFEQELTNHYQDNE